MKKPTSLIGKAFYVARKRPSHVLKTVRGVLLFYFAAFRRRLFPPPGVSIGANVRLQNNRSVMAEAPDGRIVLHEDSIIYEKARLATYGNGRIELGAQSVLGDVLIFSRYKITIGKRFLTSWNVFIEDFDPHPTDATLRGLQISDIVQNFLPRFAPCSGADVRGQWAAANWTYPGEEIVIGDDVWVGANVTILKGARIGSGCIVATGAVVLRGEYPANAVLAGNPAKVIKVLGPQ